MPGDALRLIVRGGTARHGWAAAPRGVRERTMAMGEPNVARDASAAGGFFIDPGRGAPGHPSAPGMIWPGMIWIAGGTFLMGSDQHYPEEAPAHNVRV